MGLDPIDLGSERLSWRRLANLLAHWPRDSALARKLWGEIATWETTDYLLAGVIDALNAIIWQNGGGKGRRPKPIPRPVADDPSKPKPLKGRALDEALLAMQKRYGKG